MSKLIAPTLLNSHDWLLKCPPSWKKRAYQDISNTLKRTAWEPTEAIRKGIDFEDRVYDVCGRLEKKDLTNVNVAASRHFIEVCRTVHGGEFQRTSKSFIDVDGVDYCLYGKIDVFFDDLIIDLKTTGKFKGEAQYNTGWQPPIYCHNEGIHDFMFLVAEWRSKLDFQVKDIHRVWMYLNDRKKLEDDIVRKIREFRAFLKENKELEEAYHTTYNRYNKEI